MRQSEGALALILNRTENTTQWLARWNRHWNQFHFVGGHRDPNETFCDCLDRELCEELTLCDPADYHVDLTSTVELDYESFSKRFQVPTRYKLVLFPVTPGGKALRCIDQQPETRWLTEQEIERQATVENELVSETMKRVLRLLNRTHQQFDSDIGPAGTTR